MEVAVRNGRIQAEEASLRNFSRSVAKALSLPVNKVRIFIIRNPGWPGLVSVQSLMLDGSVSGLTAAGIGLAAGAVGSAVSQGVGLLAGQQSTKLMPLVVNEVSTAGMGLRLATSGGNVAAKERILTLYRVDDTNFSPRIASDGSVPTVFTNSGNERALFVNIGQPNRAREFFMNNRGGNAIVTAVNIDASLLDRLRASAVYDKSEAAKINPMAPLIVDINKAPDQFGLRTAEHIQWLRDAIKSDTVRIIEINKIR